MEYQDFPSKTFCLTVPRSFVGKPFSVSLLSVAEKVWIREGVGSIRIFFQNFLSHSAQDFCRETLYCFTTFGCRKSFDKRGGGDYQDFLSKNFFLRVPRTFVGKPFSVSLLWGAEKVWISEGMGSIKLCCQNFSFSQCRKNSWMKPFVLCFRKNSVVKRFLDKRGWMWSMKIFRRKLFVSQCPGVS